LLSFVSLFLLKETNIHTISVLIYHGMRNISVRRVHRLAEDSVHFVHTDEQGLLDSPNPSSLILSPQLIHVEECQL
jgi:hypothetical protein